MASGRAYIVHHERSTVHEGSTVDSDHSRFQHCVQILFPTVHRRRLAPPAINSTTCSARLWSHVVVHVRDVGVRKASLAQQGSRIVVLDLSCGGGGYGQGDGCGGRGSGGRAGGKMEQQVALGAVDVQRLGAVLASARLLPPLDGLDGRRIPRGAPGGAVAFALRADAVREPHCVWYDGVAAVQQVPQGGAGGRGVEGSVAGDGGGGAGGAEVRQRDASTGDFEPLGQVCWFGWANWLVSPQGGPDSTCFVKEQTSPPVTITGPDRLAPSRGPTSAAAHPGDSRSSARPQSPSSPGQNRAAPSPGVGMPSPLSPV